MKKWSRVLAAALIVMLLIPYAVCADGLSSFVMKPGMAALRDAAYFLGEKVVGRWVTVCFDGNLFAAPSLDTEPLRRVDVGERFKVAGYFYPSEEEVWLYVEADESTAWIFAPIVKVNKVLGRTGDTEGLVGTRCRIGVISGTARSGAGEEFRNVVTVFRNERYEILEAKAASTGTIWYKISKNDYECWVSSGICKE